MPEENGGHFADDILMYIFRDEKFYSNFVADGPNEFESALVQVMPWCGWGSNRIPEAILNKIFDAMWRDQGPIL